MKNPKIELPAFVMLTHPDGDNNCAMRLSLDRDGKPQYWRDGGAWGCSPVVKRGKVRVNADYAEVTHLHGWELAPIDEVTWREDNGTYAPRVTPTPPKIFLDAKGRARKA